VQMLDYTVLGGEKANLKHYIVIWIISDVSDSSLVVTDRQV
jgi:hypothetical protein